MRTELRKQGAADRWLLVLLALLVGAVCALAAGSGAWLRVTADQMFTRLYSDAPRPAKTLRVRLSGLSNDELRASDSAEFGRRVASWLPEPLPRALGAGRVAVSSPRFTPAPITGGPVGIRRELSVASYPNLDELVRWTAGRPPRPGLSHGAIPPQITRSPLTPGFARIDIVEIGLTEEAAEALRMPVGTYVAVGRRPVSGPGSRFSVVTMLKVTGIYEPTVAAPSRLDDLSFVREPTIIPGSIDTVLATALAANTGTVIDAVWNGPTTTQWTFPPAAGVSATRAADLRRAVSRLDVTAETKLSTPAHQAHVEVRTGLDTIAEEFLRARGASDKLLLLPRVAVLLCALITLALGARVLASRRRGVTTLLRARGASLSQLVARRGVEAALLGSFGALAGLAAAAWVSGGLPTASDTVTAVSTAIACVLVVIAVGATPSATTQRSQRVRRVSAEATQLAVVALAVVACWIAASRETSDAADAIRVLTPALLAAAVAVVLLRLFAYALRTLRPVLGRSRSLGASIGLSRAAALTREFAIPATGIVLACATGVVTLSVANGLSATGEPGTPGLRRTLAVLHAGAPVAGAFAALGIACTVALTAEGRRHTTSLLRVLGATRGQSATPAAAELGPAVAVAAVCGGVTGWSLLRLLDHAELTRVLTGTAPTGGDGSAAVVVTAIVTLLAVAATVTATVASARRQPDNTGDPLEQSTVEEGT